MTDRLRLPWPDALAFQERDGRPIRLLAVSDEVDPSLESGATREGLAPLDLIVGCGDLEPAYLAFLADAFHAPLLYVRGNHDRGANWSAGRKDLPQALGRGIDELAGLPVAGPRRQARAPACRVGRG